MEWILELDFVSPQVKIMYENSYNFKTLLGTLFTIVFVLLLLIIVFYLGRDVYYETNPSIIYNSIYDEQTSVKLSNLKNCFYFQNCIEVRIRISTSKSQENSKKFDIN